MKDCLSNAVRLDKILSLLNERLSPERVLHSIGAAHTAVQLAVLWGCDPEEALSAALLHDIAKEETPSAQRQRINSSGEWAHAEDEGFPAIWHAVAGAVAAREEFDLSEAAARAIRLHPTGDAGMTLLDQILFVADYIEPGRCWEGVEDLRLLARRDRAAAVRRVVFLKVERVTAKRKPLHPRSEHALAEAKKGDRRT